MLVGFLLVVLTVFSIASYFFLPEIVNTPETRAFLARQLTLSIVVAALASGVFGWLWSTQNRDLKARQNKVFEIQRDAMSRQVEVLSAQSATCILDPTGTIEAASQGFVDILNTSSDRLLGQQLEVAVPCFKDSKLQKMLADARENGLFGSGEIVGCPSLRPGRVSVHLTVIPQFDKEGSLSQTLLVLSDKTEAKISETNRFLSLMLEELQEEIYVYDAETLEIRYVNQSARKRCGWSHDAAGSRKISDAVPNFSIDLFQEHVDPLLKRDQNASTIEIRHAEQIVEVVTRKVIGLDGAGLFVSSLRDLSHRNEIETAKLQTVSMVSHELRSPLASIKGSLSLLKSGSLGELPSSVEKVLEIADRNSERLLLIVNDILDFEKIRSGNMDFTTAPISLKALLREAVEVNQPFADRHGIRLQVGDIPDAARVHANQDRIIQVLTNLLSNAVKFSDAGDIVMVDAIDENGSWRIAISDNGPGMPEHAISDIGKPFHQQMPVDGRKREGTGLGLTIVKQILGNHGAELSVQSAVGAGSTFSFALRSGTLPGDPARFDGLVEKAADQKSNAMYS